MATSEGVLTTQMVLDQVNETEPKTIRQILKVLERLKTVSVSFVAVDDIVNDLVGQGQIALVQGSKPLAYIRAKQEKSLEGEGATSTPTEEGTGEAVKQAQPVLALLAPEADPEHTVDEGAEAQGSTALVGNTDPPSSPAPLGTAAEVQGTIVVEYLRRGMPLANDIWTLQGRLPPAERKPEWKLWEMTLSEAQEWYEHLVAVKAAIDQERTRELDAKIEASIALRLTEATQAIGVDLEAWRSQTKTELQEMVRQAVGSIPNIDVHRTIEEVLSSKLDDIFKALEGRLGGLAEQLRQEFSARQLAEGSSRVATPGEEVKYRTRTRRSWKWVWFLGAFLLSAGLAFIFREPLLLRATSLYSTWQTSPKTPVEGSADNSLQEALERYKKSQEKKEKN